MLEWLNLDSSQPRCAGQRVQRPVRTARASRPLETNRYSSPMISTCSAQNNIIHVVKFHNEMDQVVPTVRVIFFFGGGGGDCSVGSLSTLSTVDRELLRQHLHVYTGELLVSCGAQDKLFCKPLA